MKFKIIGDSVEHNIPIGSVIDIDLTAHTLIYNARRVSVDEEDVECIQEGNSSKAVADYPTEEGYYWATNPSTRGKRLILRVSGVFPFFHYKWLENDMGTNDEPTGPFIKIEDYVA